MDEHKEQALPEEKGESREEILKEREEALQEKEEKLRQEEKRHEALELLEKKHLPQVFLPAVFHAQDMEEAADETEKAFRQAVQQAVEERLKETSPKTGVMQDMTALPDSDYYAARYPHLI